MGPTLSKKETASQIKDLRAKIGDSKDCIKAEFRNFGKVSKVYVKATAAYKKAKAAFDKKPKIKQERKLDVALEQFYQAHDSYKAVYNVIESYFNSIEQNYNEICDLLDMRGAYRKLEKTTLEFERYKDWLENKLAIMSEDVPELVEDDNRTETYADDETVETEGTVEEATATAAPTAAATAGNVSQIAVSPVSINPVIIDMSSIVENAVDNTIAKFNLMFDKKLRDYFDNLTITGAPTVVKEVVKEVETAETSDAEAPVSAETVELQADVLTKEQEIYNKLKTMSEEVTAMLESLEVISGKQKE